MSCFNPDLLRLIDLREQEEPCLESIEELATLLFTKYLALRKLDMIYKIFLLVPEMPTFK